MENEEKREAMKKWIKENYIIIAILVFAFLIRLYIFILTKNQPLWWDEGEYGLRAKAFAFNTPLTGWYGAREVLVPFIFSIILRLGGNEIVWRFLQLIVSFASVFMVYFLGKEMFDKRTALIATTILAVNAVTLFFTGRILTYLWAPLFFLLTFYLFYTGYVENKGKKYLYSLPIVAAVGLSIYGSLAFGILAILIYLFITERFRFLKKKELWVAALIGFISLIPQFIYSKIQYGVFIGRWAGLQSSKPPNDFSLLLGYFKLFPHLFGNIFAIVIVISAIFLIGNIIFYFDLVLKNENKKLKSYLLISLWAICVLGFYTYVGVGWGVIYDAFVLSFLPAAALIGGAGLDLLYSIKFDKRVIAIIILVVIVLGGYYQLTYAKNMVNGKLTSFDSIRDAGNWIKENSNKNDIIISSSLPQMTYYSERETYSFLRHSIVADDPTIRETEEDFDKFVKEKKPKFITDSVWEYVPDWVHTYASKHNDTLTPVQIYYMDPQKTQVSLIIYKTQY